MKVVTTIYILGLGLGVWIGQHGGQRWGEVTVLEWLVLIALVVGSVVLLALAGFASRVAPTIQAAVERREEVE